ASGASTPAGWGGADRSGRGGPKSVPSHRWRAGTARATTRTRTTSPRFGSIRPPQIRKVHSGRAPIAMLGAASAGASAWFPAKAPECLPEDARNRDRDKTNRHVIEPGKAGQEARAAKA